MDEEARWSNGWCNVPLLGISALSSYSQSASPNPDIMITEQWGQGTGEVTSIGVLLIFLTPVPNALELSKTPLKWP